MSKTNNKEDDEAQKGSQESVEVKMSKKRKLLVLFTTFFRIGLFTFGGGFAMIPLIRKEIVENRGWVEKDKFLDAVSVTQSVPGAVAINLSIFFGYNIAGIFGAFVSALGVVLPSFLIILIIALNFKKFSGNPIAENIFKGIRPAVVALIIYAGYELGKGIDWSLKLILTLGIVFTASAFFGVSPIILIIGVLIIGTVFWLNAYIKNNSQKAEQTNQPGELK
ncbi:MAG: chromate transporter [Halothermotrichaceae bacterium]